MKTIAKCTVRYGAFRVRVSLLFNEGLWHVPVRRGYPHRPPGRRDWGGECTYDETMSVQNIENEGEARRRFAHSVVGVASNYVFPVRKV